MIDKRACDRLADDFEELYEMTQEEIKRYCGEQEDGKR
jgi:hypothetical protein